MNFLFVRTFSSIDGTLTLQMRLAQTLTSRGNKCYFWFTCAVDEQIIKSISGYAEYFIIEKIRDFKNHPELPYIDVIHAAAGGDLIEKVYKARDNFFSNAPIIFLATASNYFIHRSKIGYSPDGAFYKKFIRKLPAENLAFLSESVRAHHIKFHKQSFLKSPIIPNAINLPSKQIKRENIDRKKIVSLGRLAKSKEYVFAMLDVLVNLNKTGQRFTFYIYGGGDYMDPLKDKIQSCKLEDQVFLKGELSYENINEAFLNAGFFIGMGSAIIEGSSFGIPAIQAIEYTSEPKCYGWFFENNNLEIGAFQEGSPTKDIEFILRESYYWDLAQYDNAAKKSFEKSQQFSIDKATMQFYNFSTNADKVFSFKTSFFERFTRKVLRQIFKPIALSPQENIKN